jgi:hypothetical protein
MVAGGGIDVFEGDFLPGAQVLKCLARLWPKIDRVILIGCAGFGNIGSFSTIS